MTLKRQNTAKIGAFLLTNTVVFLICALELELSDWQALLAAITKWPVPVALSPVLFVLMDGLFPSHVKDILVFWKIKDPLPGTRAFSELAHKDPRISINVLRKQLGTIPRSPTKQNAAWYQLYRLHENDPRVLDVHGKYLLMRSLTAISTIMLIIFGISIWLSSPSIKLSLYYVTYIVIQFLLIRFSAANYGDRFVCTVLAVSSTSGINQGSDNRK